MPPPAPEEIMDSTSPKSEVFVNSHLSSTTSKKYLSYSQSAHHSDSGVMPVLVDTAEDKTNSTSGLNFFQLSRRRKLALCLCTCANFMSGCSFSLPAPFFPNEALKKGMSQTMIGLVFSLYELMLFIFCPLIGFYLTTLGPKFTHISSTFSAGLSTVLFGVLKFCPSGTSFVVLSFMCRAVQGVAYSGLVIASFAIVSSEFPERVATVFGIIETGTQVGLMLGPIIGGALFDLGGYALPFYVLGCIMLINGVFMYRVLPPPKDMGNKQRPSPVSTLLKTPMVFIPLISIFIGNVSLLFLQPTLANNLAPFNLSSTVIGLVFFIQPFLCCVTGPIWGYLTDTKDLRGSIIVLGHVITALGFFIIADIFSFIPFTVWTVAVGLALYGATYETTLIPTLKCMVIGALDIGYEDNIDTYGVLSGLLNSSFYFGGVFGPFLGGLFDFKMGACFVGVVNIFVSLVCLVFFTWRSWSRKSRQYSELNL